MARRKKIDRADFASAHHQGLNRKQLAEHFGITPSAVTVIRKELGLPLEPPPPPPVNNARKIDRDEVRRLVEDGWTNRGIAKHFNVHEDSISRVRVELGISHEYRGHPMTPERLERIAGMIADGWSHAEIGRTEGADPETLHKYFPGTAWTTEQRAEYIATLRSVNHFNRRPKHYDRRKYETGKAA